MLEVLGRHRGVWLPAPLLCELAWSPRRAARLKHPEVSAKREVGRLRALGWPILARTGRHGGYRLAQT